MTTTQNTKTTVKTKIEIEVEFLKGGEVVHRALGFSYDEIEKIMAPGVQRLHGPYIKRRTREIVTTTVIPDWE